MKLNLECIVCNINQVLRTAKTMELPDENREKIMREVLAYLSCADYNRCNPEVITGTWEIIKRHSGNENPYKEIKSFYNRSVKKLYPELKRQISRAEHPVELAVRYAVAGNLIDFAANHAFDLEGLRQKLKNADEVELAVDDSGVFEKRLCQMNEKAKRGMPQVLLYLGDNCGEIVLDKLLIETIREMYSEIQIYYGVRGEAIVNDVTREDALEVGMEVTAEVVDNGDGALGTVLERTSPEFRKIFERADVILCKGQGNYESLSEITGKEIYHLFMAKCDPVARRIGVPRMSVVCVRQYIQKLDTQNKKEKIV